MNFYSKHLLDPILLPLPNLFVVKNPQNLLRREGVPHSPPVSSFVTRLLPKLPRFHRVNVQTVELSLRTFRPESTLTVVSWMYTRKGVSSVSHHPEGYIGDLRPQIPPSPKTLCSVFDVPEDTTSEPSVCRGKYVMRQSPPQCLEGSEFPPLYFGINFDGFPILGNFLSLCIWSRVLERIRFIKLRILSPEISTN